MGDPANRSAQAYKGGKPTPPAIRTDSALSGASGKGRPSGPRKESEVPDPHSARTPVPRPTTRYRKLTVASLQARMDNGRPKTQACEPVRLSIANCPGRNPGFSGSSRSSRIKPRETGSLVSTLAVQLQAAGFFRPSIKANSRAGARAKDPNRRCVSSAAFSVFPWPLRVSFPAKPDPRAPVPWYQQRGTPAAARGYPPDFP